MSSNTALLAGVAVAMSIAPASAVKKTPTDAELVTNETAATVKGCGKAR